MSDTTNRPWNDASLSMAERVERLLSEMTLEEKAGLFFQTIIGLSNLDEPNVAFSAPSAREYIEQRNLTHFNLVGGAATAREMASWHNELQRLAASTRLGIPVTLSTDPRHSFTDNPGTAMLAGPFSQWPEPLGLAATRDEKLVEQFGDIAREEYLAVGLRVALHPQVDLATEPRWSRQSGTFGEDASVASALGAAYVRGFQTDSFGRQSVSTMTKHFPGGGPQKDGEDPHFAHGREQVYPGGMGSLHLAPFKALIAAGTRQIMPYYGMPVGTEWEEVGFAFNRGVLTDLLRTRLGFDGIICSDWGVLNDSEIFGAHFPARAWGVENLTPAARMAKALTAGVDQFGGEACPELLVKLVASGTISESRVNESARRLLREKFELGLFDDPFIDENAADIIVGNAEFRRAGDYAQRASITILTNGTDQKPLLPLSRGRRLYVEGIDPTIAGAYGEIVDDPANAEIALIRLAAPFEERSTVFENFFHSGSLDFPDSVLDRVRTIASQVPTVVDIFADRPAILEPITTVAHAVCVNWGASAEALLDVLTGAFEPQGRLPFDLPRSMDAVRVGREDVPFDTPNPLFRYGHGLSYPAV